MHLKKDDSGQDELNSLRKGGRHHCSRERTCMMKTYTPLEAKQSRKINRIFFLSQSLISEGVAFCSLE